MRAPTVLISLPFAAALSCVDEEGAAVDWWFMLKHPRWKDKSHSEPVGDGTGTGYVFLTATSTSWKVGKKPITDEHSLLGKQLEDIYAGSDGNYVFYNDEWPNGSFTETYGHSKGFFSYSHDSAFWVQHSIPKFPNYVDDGYLYGSGQCYYGQHAFCMTMSPANLDAVAGVMLYANPWIYDHKVDGTLPNVNAIINKEKASTGTTVVDVPIGWGTLKVFGKSVASHEDMLQNLLAPTLDDTLFSQSWLNSGHPLGPSCPSSGNDVLDILVLTLPGPPSDTHVTEVDHSKWAVAKSSTSSWVCALDNNHVESQERRSGLAVCLEHPALSTALRAVAVKENSCRGSSCGGAGAYPCKSGCTYIHKDDEEICDVSDYGCYNCSLLPSACPECQGTDIDMLQV